MIPKDKSIDIIINKKLFEKQLQKIPGFSHFADCQGIDSHSMIFIPEHDVVVTAGIHALGETLQHLYLYKIDAKIDKSSQKINFPIHRRASEICKNLSNKKRSSAVYDFGQSRHLQSQLLTELAASTKHRRMKSTSGQSLDVGSKEISEIREVTGATAESEAGNGRDQPKWFALGVN